MYKRILVLGAKGMLGTEVEKALFIQMPVGTCILGTDSYAGNVLDVARLDFVRKEFRPDLVINCAGKPNEGSLVNSMGPWNVALVFSCTIWHISTDCVFNHRVAGIRTVHDTPDPVTEYGVSKTMGEINAPHVSNIRTSFIGYRHGLLKWFLDTPFEGVIDGWANAVWSGSTVESVATALAYGVRVGYQAQFIEHLCYSFPVSKWKLLTELCRQLRSDIQVERKEEPYINRQMYPSWPYPLMPFKDSIDCLKSPVHTQP